jgi:hypothetical protein
MSYIKNCQICKKKLTKCFSLGNQPLCDDLLKINSKKKNILYPINILFCKNCIIAFNEVQIVPKKLFPKNYHYRSSLTQDVIKGMDDLKNNIEKEFGSLKGKKVLDIGCNDGSLLNLFKKKQAITIGVEPTNACFSAKKRHYIINNFFSKDVAVKIKKKFKEIDYIIFTNVFAHINNLDNLIKSLKILISPNTNIIIENHYLGSILDKNQFDTFYHEHPRTYSLKSFLEISKLLNMNLYKFQFPKRYGGNIRVILSNKKPNKILKMKLNKIINNEKKFYIKLLKFKNFISIWKKKTKNMIIKIKDSNKIIVGKAFPGRASILINLLNLNSKIISMIFEKEKSPKIGYMVPNTDIPIVSDSNLKKLNGNEIIINFAWHIKDEIKKYLLRKKINNKVINIL